MNLDIGYKLNNRSYFNFILVKGIVRVENVEDLLMPNEFLLKSTLITTDLKRDSSGRTRIYEYTPPPQLTL